MVERAQPSLLVAIVSIISKAEHSNRTARVKWEEGGDDVKSTWPLYPGLHTCYNAGHNGRLSREVAQIPKKSAQFGLKAAIRLHEAGIASNGASATAP